MRPSFSTPRSCRIGRTLTAMTRTYVSLDLIIIVLLPSAAVCFEFRKIRVSVFSWLQWVKPSRLIEWLQTKPSSWVTITVLLEYIFTILSARKLNSSVLLVLSLKKLCQFCGVFPLPITSASSAYVAIWLCLEDQYIRQTQYLFSCKYNCMLELFGLPLELHILQTSSISLNAMYSLKPIRPKWWN